MEGFPILTLITFLPVLGMILILFIPKESKTQIKIISLVMVALQLLLAIIMMTKYNYNAGGIFDVKSFQFVEKFKWIENKCANQI